MKYCSVHVFAAAHVHVKLQLMWWISRVTVQKSSSFRTLHRTEEDRTSSREGARGRDRESKGIDLDPPWWSPYPPPHHHPWCCRLWNCISPKSSSFLGLWTQWAYANKKKYLTVSDLDGAKINMLHILYFMRSPVFLFWDQMHSGGLVGAHSAARE